MRADRLLRIILLLQRHPRLSARELAERLEVSTRTVMRDMEALSAAGVPVYTERGRNGGCVLLPGYRADVSGLTPREAQALFAWTGPALSEELGLRDALQSAMGKLSATLPVRLQDEAEALSGSIVVDRRRWFAEAEDNGALPVLRQAVVNRRRVRLRYASATDGKPVRRTVDPWGLVEQAGRWYLVGTHRGSPRMFRVSRVASVDVLDEVADRPAGLDLRAEWGRLRSGLEELNRPVGVDVVVRARPSEAGVFRRIAAPMLVSGGPVREVPAEGDDWTRLAMRFRVRQAACAVLLGFGSDVEVLEPPDLRAELLRRAREAVEVYG
ncbi:putative DNA-binding transcriptional regulator YafY [Kribbella sp. VKM Ac-2527]|uniref:Putative DNA-binding transcriptional regulator YafY n=1 Tax=Kribbella caucasensis TaxID=2512215 RepID=A0A4R6KG43_9ACTN|nr:WYL domain-containing protein [Kribbella sp. VKM Ac-2527]TDO47237.1 putative DNA-binding transcriptional regulator YafY [Kribbella sp. VKM Ac-2527]